MFWLGMAVLIGGLLWSIYGFYLRVMISKWAPVTGMYETVIYVPFFVSMLGAWFTLLPLTWPGLKNAWRLSALPGTWEAQPLTDEQLTIMRPARWTAGGYLLAVPRIALMALVFYVLAMAPYAAGERTIINLRPQVDLGQTLPDANDLIVWIVGMTLLLPTMWYLPRVLLALATGIAMVPLTLRAKPASVMPQVYPRWPFAVAATLVAFCGAFIAWYAPMPGRAFSPLTPVLRDNFWLTIHVLTIVSSYGAGALAWGLGLIALGYYLFGRYREPAQAALVTGHLPAAGSEAEDIEEYESHRRPPEQCAALAGYIYKAMQVAVLLLAAGTILGGLWADVSWGRFWGWDPKEVWALISLLTYLAILHGRYAGWFGNFGLAAGSVLGATAILMSWYGVNFVLGAGLHAYAFGAGGQREVGACLLLNWLFLGAAAARYRWESGKHHAAKASTTEHELSAGSK
jgi:ABC-type transport system involved in cytochrome c biogenesis permease subunit